MFSRIWVDWRLCLKKTIATSPADMLAIEKSMADFLRRSFKYQKMKGMGEDFKLH
jgi:hypothetical protein